jgi:hypothetical protein
VRLGLVQVRGKPRDPSGHHTAVQSTATEMSAVPGSYGSFSRSGGGGSNSGKSWSPWSREAPATELVTSLGPTPLDSPRFGAKALRNRSMLNNSEMKNSGAMRMIDVEVLPLAGRLGDEFLGCAPPYPHPHPHTLSYIHTHAHVCAAGQRRSVLQAWQARHLRKGRCLEPCFKTVRSRESSGQRRHQQARSNAPLQLTTTLGWACGYVVGRAAEARDLEVQIEENDDELRLGMAEDNQPLTDARRFRSMVKGLASQYAEQGASSTASPFAVPRSLLAGRHHDASHTTHALVALGLERDHCKKPDCAIMSPSQAETASHTTVVSIGVVGRGLV